MTRPSLHTIPAQLDPESFLYAERSDMFRQRSKGGRRDRAEDGLEGDPRQEPRLPLQPPGTGARAAHDREHHDREHLRLQRRRLVRGKAFYFIITEGIWIYSVIS